MKIHNKYIKINAKPSLCSVDAYKAHIPHTQQQQIDHFEFCNIRWRWMRPVFDYTLCCFFSCWVFVVAFEVCAFFFHLHLLHIQIHVLVHSNITSIPLSELCSFECVLKSDFAASIKMRLQFYLILFFPFDSFFLSSHSFFQFYRIHWISDFYLPWPQLYTHIDIF